MSDTFQKQIPRFKPGDEVSVISPGIYRHKQGVVIEVSTPSIDLVYRYRVQLADGTSATFFGFELTTLGQNRTA